jgi:hypothetical protein
MDLLSRSAVSRGIRTGIGRSADGPMSDLLAAIMAARKPKNLIFNDARARCGTNRNNVSEFLDSREWLASNPTRICEARFRGPHLRRRPAKNSTTDQGAFETAQVVVTAESALPRTGRCSQVLGNSYSSNRNCAGDLRANGYSRRALNPADGGSGSDLFLHNRGPRLSGARAERSRYALATNPPNRSAIVAASLAGQADFHHRTELAPAARELQIRSKARGMARKRGRPKIALALAHRGSNLVMKALLQGHSTSGRARHEHRFQLRRRGVGRPEENERAGRQLLLRSIAHEGCEFLNEGARPGRDARARNLPENSANRSTGTQAAAGSCARVASNERILIY